MGRRDIIRILLILIGLFWFVILKMPHRYEIVDDYNARYYDKGMAAQEFNLRKELKAMEESKNVPEEAKLDTNETLAKNLWAMFKGQDAAAILRDVLFMREKLHPGYNEKTVNTMLALAGVYRDLDQLQDSLVMFDKACQLDKDNLPANDPRILRDMTNLATTDYLRGDIEKDEIRRKGIFRCALNHIRDGMRIWHEQKNVDAASLSHLFYLQYLCYRELGDYSASHEAFGNMKYLERQSKNVYTLPWK